MARGRDRGRDKQGRDKQGRDKQRAGIGEIRSTGSEVARLVVDYVKQETLDPLKGLGRYVLFGVAGSVALAIGLVILAIALLRLLQGETGGTFDGNWSWAPYLICTVVVLAAAAAAIFAVVRGGSRTTGAARRRS